MQKIQIEFCKSGIPRSHPGMHFTPFVKLITVITVYPEDDGSFDIYCEPLMLSNGCGPTITLCFYNLLPTALDKLSGIVRFANGEQRKLLWPYNVPTWKRVFYREAAAASMAFLMAWKRCHRTSMKALVPQLAARIAKMIYHSHYDSVWAA